jgi:hypothetical protein
MCKHIPRKRRGKTSVNDAVERLSSACQRRLIERWALIAVTEMDGHKSVIFCRWIPWRRSAHTE